MSDWRLTPRARAGLDDIWDFTAKTWCVAQSEAYIRALVATCERIAAGVAATQNAGHIRADYRKALIGRNVLFYRKTGDGITVIRILHQLMDVEAQSI